MMLSVEELVKPQSAGIGTEMDEASGVHYVLPTQAKRREKGEGVMDSRMCN